MFFFLFSSKYQEAVLESEYGSNIMTQTVWEGKNGNKVANRMSDEREPERKEERGEGSGINT